MRQIFTGYCLVEKLGLIYKIILKKLATEGTDIEIQNSLINTLVIGRGGYGPSPHQLMCPSQLTLDFNS